MCLPDLLTSLAVKTLLSGELEYCTKRTGRVKAATPPDCGQYPRLWLVLLLQQASTIWSLSFINTQYVPAHHLLSLSRWLLVVLALFSRLKSLLSRKKNWNCSHPLWINFPFSFQSTLGLTTILLQTSIFTQDSYHCHHSLNKNADVSSPALSLFSKQIVSIETIKKLKLQKGREHRKNSGTSTL